MSKILQNFSFRKHEKNPGYEAGLRKLPFDTCLIHNNAEILPASLGGASRVRTSPWDRGTNGRISVKTAPKWITTLGCEEVETDTGEMIPGVYVTNDFRSANNRKIKALDAFCGYYQPMYARKEVSLMFHTFTQANKANLDFASMLDNVRYHYAEQLQRPVRGYIWTLELKPNEKMGGFNMHYHAGVAIDRIEINKLPAHLKFDDLWGQRTEIEFVRKNIRHYMAKYFAKQNARADGFRSYGRSRLFT